MKDTQAKQSRPSESVAGPVVTRTDGTKVEIRPKQRFRFSVEAVRANLDKFGEK